MKDDTSLPADKVAEVAGQECPNCEGTGVIERPYIAGVVNVMHGCRTCEGSGLQQKGEQ